MTITFVIVLQTRIKLVFFCKHDQFPRKNIIPSHIHQSINFALPNSSPNDYQSSPLISLFFSDAVFKSYNNSIEEMKNLSKMARDHKRLVLGSTDKSFGETRDKENIDF